MPHDEKKRYNIRIEVVHRLEVACSLIANGKIDVANCYVVIDNITNNVTGNWKYLPETPEQVAGRVAKLREAVLAASAKAVVVCEIKPIGTIDVRPYSLLIHRYLLTCGKTGYGCRTQIRRDYLKADGIHIKPQFDSVLDRTYACALLGVHVSNPTPFDELAPKKGI